MKIGIVCASDTELEPFLEYIKDCIKTEKAMLKFYEGKIEGMPVVALYSGVCKVNAAIATQILIDCYQVSAVVNAGTAGGMDKKIQLFDTVISTQSVYHDVAEDILTEFHPWLSDNYFNADQKLLQIAKSTVDGLPQRGTIYFGKMVTGEAFIKDDRREAICETYSPLSVDMETASIAHVCHVNQIPFIAIRSITDTASHSGLEHFEQNCEKASGISKNIVLALLHKLKESE